MENCTHWLNDDDVCREPLHTTTSLVAPKLTIRWRILYIYVPYYVLETKTLNLDRIVSFM